MFRFSDFAVWVWQGKCSGRISYLSELVPRIPTVQMGNLSALERTLDSPSSVQVCPPPRSGHLRWHQTVGGRSVSHPALARPSELARLALQVGLFLWLSAGLDVSDACCHGGVHSAWPSCGAGRVSCGGPISERRNLDDRSTAAVSGAARPVTSRSLRPKCGDRFIPENRCLCCYSVSGPPLVMLPLLAGQGGGGGGGAEIPELGRAGLARRRPSHQSPAPPGQASSGNCRLLRGAS